MIEVYHSIFAELIQDFIAYKRAAGYKYETEAVYLKASAPFYRQLRWVKIQRKSGSILLDNQHLIHLLQCEILE